MKIRYGKFIDPARGGRRIEERVSYSHSTVLNPGGFSMETTHEVWLDIGTLMEPVDNVQPEQPPSLAKKMMEQRLDNPEDRWYKSIGKVRGSY